MFSKNGLFFQSVKNRNNTKKKLFERTVILRVKSIAYTTISNWIVRFYVTIHKYKAKEKYCADVVAVWTGKLHSTKMYETATPI